MTAATKKMRVDVIPLSSDEMADRVRIENGLDAFFGTHMPDVNDRVNGLLLECYNKRLYRTTHSSFTAWMNYALKKKHPTRQTVHRQVKLIVAQNELLKAGISEEKARRLSQRSADKLAKVPKTDLPAVMDAIKQDPQGTTSESVDRAIASKLRIHNPDAEAEVEVEATKTSDVQPQATEVVAEAQAVAVSPTITTAAATAVTPIDTKPEPVCHDWFAEAETRLLSEDPEMQKALVNRLFSLVYHKPVPNMEPEPKPETQVEKQEPKAPEVVVSYEPDAVVKYVLSCPTDVQVSMLTTIIAKTNETACQDVITYIACSESVAFLSHKLPDGKGKNLNRLLSARYNKFVEPTVEEIQSYLNEKKYDDIDAEEFHASYERQGWKLANGNQLTNWKAAVTTWRKMRDKDSKKQNLSKVHPDVYDPSKGLKSGDIL